MNLTTPTMQLHYLREYSIRFLFNLKILIGLSNETGMCIHIYYCNIRLDSRDNKNNGIAYFNSFYLIRYFKRPAQHYYTFPVAVAFVLCLFVFSNYNPCSCFCLFKKRIIVVARNEHKQITSLFLPNIFLLVICTY